MAIPRVVYGLAKKRAQLVAELEHSQGRHDYCRAGIAAIDAVLPLWDCEPPVYKRQHKTRPAIIRQLSRRIVGTLRDGSRTTRQIIDAVSVGLELDKEERHKLLLAVSDRLKEMRREGRVTATMGPDRRNSWRLRPYAEDTGI